MHFNIEVFICDILKTFLIMGNIEMNFVLEVIFQNNVTKDIMKKFFFKCCKAHYYSNDFRFHVTCVKMRILLQQGPKEIIS